ncbi:MAG: HAD-IA family hydrolase [Planctomycetales bacterium]
MIDTLLLDMGNVLLDFSHARMCQQIAEVCGLPAERVWQELFEAGLESAFETGRCTEVQLHRHFEELSGRSLYLDELLQAASNIFVPTAGMHTLLPILKQLGLRLVLLSNINSAHYRFVREHFPILDQLDAFVLSYEVGEMKPHPAIFAAALRAAGTAPERCFYTDDIAPYVAAGRTHGVQAEVFTNAAEFVRHLQSRGIDLPDQALA